MQCDQYLNSFNQVDRVILCLCCVLRFIYLKGQSKQNRERNLPFSDSLPRFCCQIWAICCFKTYLQELGRKREIFLLLVHSPNSYIARAHQPDFKHWIAKLFLKLVFILQFVFLRVTENLKLFQLLFDPAACDGKWQVFLCKQASVL